MHFDSEHRNTLAFREFAINAGGFTQTASHGFPAGLPGADREWDSDSLYVSETGETIIPAARPRLRGIFTPGICAGSRATRSRRPMRTRR